jgi:hypothetical protein
VLNFGRNLRRRKSHCELDIAVLGCRQSTASWFRRQAALDILGHWAISDCTYDLLKCELGVDDLIDSKYRAQAFMPISLTSVASRERPRGLEVDIST